MKRRPDAVAIDLAPGHKLGLSVDNPVLLAGGSIGCGEATHAELDLRALGGVVVGPLTLHSRAGAPMPRSAAVPGGLLLETGTQNRGLDATLRLYAPLWRRLDVPVIAQVADFVPREVGRLCARLSAVEGLHAVELLLPRGAEGELVRRMVEAAQREGDLPVWAKLTPERAREQATAALAAGASAVVIAQPPLGAFAGAERRSGSLQGPATFPLMLQLLREVAALNLGGVLIACGGIHTLDQARQALASGARALQIDTAAWLEPRLPALLAAALA